MAQITEATAQPDTEPALTEVTDAELEEIVGGILCCPCSDLSCRL
jgi:hypothetical protein